MASSARDQVNDFARRQAEQPFVPPQNGQRQQRQQQTNGSAGATYNFNFGPKNNSSKTGGQSGGNRIGPGATRNTFSPLADPEFFTNADVRFYCESARAVFMTLAFDLSMAAEILHAVLREVPDPEGKAFGSAMRARRVTRRLSKVADEAKSAAKNAAAAYAAFQREYSPEMQHNPRARQAPRRKFDFSA
ncbi:plasmid transfer protein TraA [Streptomyces sp. NPDC050804]|uniref:plasmid transfer protein TraA n=1 Tax=Streptomyces sp. NPDC050804 TaxID=3154745 RepID=UPI0034446681